VEAVAVARLLLEAGADPRGRDHDGCTVAMYASYSGNVRVLELLFERGAEPFGRNLAGSTCLMYSAYMGQLGVAHLLLRRFGDRSRELLGAEDREGMTAMQWAESGGQGRMSAFLEQYASGVPLEWGPQAHRHFPGPVRRRAQELLRHASRLPLPRDLVCEITARVVKSETWWMLEGRGAGGLRAATCSEAAA